MSFAETYLPEFDHEIATTRKLLEIVPFDHPDWKPHPKSMSMLQLAKHLAQIPGLAVSILEDDQIDFADGKDRSAPECKSNADLVGYFDAVVTKTRQVISQVQDSVMSQTWSLKAGEQTFATLPRAAAMRMIVMNHLIHHRGQLSVYLRMNDVRLPSIYGPTADT